jgi:hypothetical protein
MLTFYVKKRTRRIIQNLIPRTVNMLEVEFTSGDARTLSATCLEATYVNCNWLFSEHYGHPDLQHGG